MLCLCYACVMHVVCMCYACVMHVLCMCYACGMHVVCKYCYILVRQASILFIFIFFVSDVDDLSNNTVNFVDKSAKYMDQHFCSDAAGLRPFNFAWCNHSVDMSAGQHSSHFCNQLRQRPHPWNCIPHWNRCGSDRRCSCVLALSSATS